MSGVERKIKGIKEQIDELCSPSGLRDVLVEIDGVDFDNPPTFHEVAMCEGTLNSFIEEVNKIKKQRDVQMKKIEVELDNLLDGYSVTLRNGYSASTKKDGWHLFTNNSDIYLGK